MATLSTTAWVLHELGLAAGFGGTLFGQLAMNPAVHRIQSKRERGKVSHVAWDRYMAVNAPSLLLMAGTWYAARKFHRNDKLTITKDVLVGGALVSGIASMALGHFHDRETEALNSPLTVKSRPRAETERRAQVLARAVKAAGAIYIAMNGAVLATTTLLALRARR